MLSRIFRAVLCTVFAIFVTMLFAASASAQLTSAGTMPLPADKAFKLSATRDGDGRINLQWHIEPGYYLYQDRFGFKRGLSDLPTPELRGNAQSKDDPTFGQTTVYHDGVVTVLRLQDQASGPLEVHYQGCQDNGICYPPITRYVDPVSLAVSAPGASVPTAMASEWTASAALPQSGATSVASASGGIALAADNGGMVGALLKDGGAPMVLASFLIFGILLAFTPCVLPMYPILAGAIARQGEKVTLFRGFTLSLAYVLAMATAFGLLGIVAAWSGQNLQMALQSPLAIGAVSLLFLLLALSMFGLFELQLPSRWVSAIGGLGSGNRGSLAAAGLLGFTSALIVGPCVTAPLAGALIYIAQTGDVMLGAASLYALGLGKGIPLIVFGTFGPNALPKAGVWMTLVRQAFGFVFIATAIWMVSRLVPAEAGLALWALLAIGVAVWLGAFDTLDAQSSGGRKFAKAAGIAMALYRIVLGVGAASGSSDPLRPLGNLVAQRHGKGEAQPTLAFSTAGTVGELQSRMEARNDRPSLLYVTADWCVSCSVIERSVLSDPTIKTELSDFNLIKLDVSGNTADQQQIMRELQVVGPPTMIFVDSHGREKADTRLVGDVTRTSLQASVKRMDANR